jgi:hypothetical protein
VTNGVGEGAHSEPHQDFDDDVGDDFGEEPDEDFDPDRLAGCAYWRCEEIFERRSANHIFCRKACRSRQRKWERSQERKARKAQARADWAAMRGR